MDSSQVKIVLKESLISFFNAEKIYWSSMPFSIVIDDLLAIIAQGKLSRGTLFLQAVLQGNLNHPQIQNYLDIAMAIEITHTAFLVHDDIMDKSSERRGEPTAHELWKNRSENLNLGIDDKTHYGYSQAICVGDISLFLAQKLLTQAAFLLNNISIAHFAHKEWTQVCFGQILDMHLGVQEFDTHISDEEILRVYLSKTAQYTFSVPLTLASYCLNLHTDLETTLYEIGQNLGILYQIQDDYLDIFGDIHLVKKSLGQDIREKKKTLYLCKLYNALPIKEKIIFNTLSQKTTCLDSEEIRWLQDSMHHYGIIKAVERTAHIYTKVVQDKLILLKDYPQISILLENILKDSQTRIH